ncbi:MAG: hypothetical protein J7L76_01940, partial [Spirochaetaceae bacterium]|nr:hypothetical protein [Spirochaetaceae bacterium]
MRIALFHYHLKPGGVTDVIIYSIRALLSRMGKLDEIRLVTGNKENTEIVLETVRAGFNRQVADKVRLDVLEEIGYTEEGHSTDPDQLKARLLA